MQRRAARTGLARPSQVPRLDVLPPFPSSEVASWHVRGDRALVRPCHRPRPLSAPPPNPLALLHHRCTSSRGPYTAALYRLAIALSPLLHSKPPAGFAAEPLAGRATASLTRAVGHGAPHHRAARGHVVQPQEDHVCRHLRRTRRRPLQVGVVLHRRALRPAHYAMALLPYHPSTPAALPARSPFHPQPSLQPFSHSAR
jgi:hypothetical protein